MHKTVLDGVYDLLKNIGAVDNESKFSTDWLARSECYMRTLRFKQSNPSLGTLAICASKLQHYASCMTATDAHAKLGKQFRKPSQQCHTQINTDAKGCLLYTSPSPRDGP